MLQEKLNVLKDNEVITEKVYDYSQESIHFLKERKIIQGDDEADVLITHLAMATQRQYTDETVNEIDAEILDEISESEHFDFAKELWNDLKALSPTAFDKSEDGYFHLHLVTLLQAKQD